MKATKNGQGDDLPVCVVGWSHAVAAGDPLPQPLVRSRLVEVPLDVLCTRPSGALAGVGLRLMPRLSATNSDRSRTASQAAAAKAVAAVFAGST